MAFIRALLLLSPLVLGTLSSRAGNEPHSVARVWDEEILAAIRVDLPHPPVHARNLFHFSVAMYDAWAAYDPVAVGYIYHAKHTAANVESARREAISFAAYRVLVERYTLSRGASTTLAALAARMSALGYNASFTSTATNTPAGVGNAVAAAVSAYCLNDGSRQTASPAYSDAAPAQGGYTYVNAALSVANPGANPADVSRWQRLSLVTAFTQNGLPIESTQSYLGPHWMGVRPFALARAVDNTPWIDPGPPPRLNTASDAAFRSNVVEVIRASSALGTADGVTMDISPGAFGNSSLGTNDGTGHPENPATGLPYAPNVVPRGDFTRILAEFWADGPNSETPPGHWNSLANAAADHPQFEHRIGGTGPVLDRLEWDVKMYFALNAAVHDAACAAWSLKRFYDGWRPLSAVRHMAQLGQSTNPAEPSYHANGLPLVTDLIEMVTAQTAAAGQRHQGLTAGKVAIRAWPGQPANPATQTSGVRWIHGDTWVPFQKNTFVTPAFPGYVSGHSTFSRAAAEVLTAMTGSPFFPGGMGVFTANANSYLTFERGPSQTITLQWATYYDAADQAGLSRIWGGIHPPADDLAGRIAGSQAGQGAWNKARRYWDASILNDPCELVAQTRAGAAWQVRAETLRAMRYRLESAPALEGPWTADTATVTATDAYTSFTSSSSTNAVRFLRAALAP